MLSHRSWKCQKKDEIAVFRGGPRCHRALIGRTPLERGDEKWLRTIIRPTRAHSVCVVEAKRAHLQTATATWHIYSRRVAHPHDRRADVWLLVPEPVENRKGHADGGGGGVLVRLRAIIASPLTTLVLRDNVPFPFLEKTLPPFERSMKSSQVEIVWDPGSFSFSFHGPYPLFLLGALRPSFSSQHMAIVLLSGVAENVKLLLCVSFLYSSLV